MVTKTFLFLKFQILLFFFGQQSKKIFVTFSRCFHMESPIRHTLRSWVHDIFILFRTVSPRLENNDRLKCCAEHFNASLFSNCREKVLKGSKFYAHRISECDIYRSCKVRPGQLIYVCQINNFFS